MQLSRLTVALLIFSATSACHDSTAPSGPSYVLTAVDGRPLPFLSQGIDGSSTLLSGTLVLESGGRAVRIDHYRDYSANGGGMTFERDEVLSGPYTIANNTINARRTGEERWGTGV